MEEKEPNLVPAYYAKKIEQIKFLDKPISQGGKLKTLSRKEFCQQEGAEWTEVPMVDGALRKEWLEPERGAGAGQSNNFVVQHLFNPNDKVAVCQMDSRMGKGLIATESFEKGELIGFYVGEIRARFDGSDGQFRPYAYEITQKEVRTVWLGRKLGQLMMDAEHYRNYTSYAQHGISDKDLHHIPEQLRKLVVTNNAVFIPTHYMAFPVFMMIASRAISKGEFIQYSYGSYWNSQRMHGQGDGSFYVHDHYGQIIGSVNSRWEFSADPNYIGDQVPPASRGGEDSQLLVKQVESDFEKALDGFGVNALHNMSHALLAADIEEKRRMELLGKYIEITKANDVVKVVNSLVNFVNRDLSAPDLYDIKLEMILFHNLLARDFREYCARKGDFSVRSTVVNQEPAKNVRLNKSELKELLSRLKLKTDMKWSCQFAAQLVFLIGEQKKPLEKVCSFFESNEIYSKSLAKRQGGKWYLVFETRSLNLDTLNRVDGERMKNLLKK